MQEEIKKAKSVGRADTIGPRHRICLIMAFWNDDHIILYSCTILCRLWMSVQRKWPSWWARGNNAQETTTPHPLHA